MEYKHHKLVSSGMAYPLSDGMSMGQQAVPYGIGFDPNSHVYHDMLHHQQHQQQQQQQNQQQSFYMPVNMAMNQGNGLDSGLGYGSDVEMNRYYGGQTRPNGSLTSIFTSSEPLQSLPPLYHNHNSSHQMPFPSAPLPVGSDVDINGQNSSLPPRLYSVNGSALMQDDDPDLDVS